MTGLDRVKAAFEAFAAGRATPEQHSAVREATAAGQVQVVSGERAVQFGRDANGATVITGDRNVVFSVGPGEVAALLKALAGERRRVNQLPADLPDFEGRTAEIEALEGALRAGGQGAISAIDGMGGAASRRSRSTSGIGWRPRSPRTACSTSSWAGCPSGRAPRSTPWPR